ncbi:hypothetical protein C8R44DRAFT_866153 [Mycena epipterygia]|nr:hypothetical protein C8R44DRAFT_866153 [Mycena epipterygia]
MILDLCVELLHEIGSEIATPDQRALRAVSRQLRSAIEPLFFASTSLVLDIDKPVDGSEQRLAKMRMLKLLKPALQSLTRLRAVHWIFNDSDPQWAQAIVADVLNTCAHVEELRVLTRISEPAHDHFAFLGPISNLRILSAETQKGSREGELLLWVGQVISKSPHLESLRLSSTTPEISETLQKKRIQLKDISVPTADDALFGYLASYSGLERLTIRRISDNRHGGMLFEKVIPRHKASLVELSCPGCSEGACSFRRINVALISELRNLETLEMTVNVTEMAPNPGNKQDIVELFLEMVSDMPALRNIAILAAAPSGWACGAAMSRQKQAWQGRISKTVDSFGQARGSPALSRLIKTHHRRVATIRAGRMFW